MNTFAAHCKWFMNVIQSKCYRLPILEQTVQYGISHYIESTAYWFTFIFSIRQCVSFLFFLWINSENIIIYSYRLICLNSDCHKEVDLNVFHISTIIHENHAVMYLQFCLKNLYRLFRLMMIVVLQSSARDFNCINDIL